MEVGCTRRRTVVVEGALAFRMRRKIAAQRNENGLQILTLPQLASRLAGGFARPLRSPDLKLAIDKALKDGGFSRINKIRHLPGMVRAVSKSLSKIWMADFDTGDSRWKEALSDITLLDTRVRQNLPAGVFAPSELRNAALKRMKHAETLFGTIEFDQLFEVPPIWEPLLEALGSQVNMRWRNRIAPKPIWLRAEMAAITTTEPSTPTVCSCADPLAEVVEALRWVRELIVSGTAKPEEIAVCAVSPETWDEHFLTLSCDARIPLHFSHGIPALASRDGQACAALADVLLNGLSQERVRRLLRQVRRQAPMLTDLPDVWHDGLNSEAGLLDLDQWKRALDRAVGRRRDKFDPRPTLFPVIELLSNGIAAAEKAGEDLLGPRAREVWLDALRYAPRRALAFALEDLRVPDDHDPASSPVWCPVDHLVGAPRAFIRFIGLTTRSWPRRNAEDPLLPSRVVKSSDIRCPLPRERDEAQLAFLLQCASGGAVLSFARRDSRGGVLTPSPLLPKTVDRALLLRTRIPSHAFSESDRLLARPRETARLPPVAAATAAWRNWYSPSVTGHDGRVRPNHPAIERALSETQSATSLQLLFRNPLAFVWRYALGWQTPNVDDQPLERDDRGFGNLVHSLLKRTVNSLEPAPGLGRARVEELDRALDAATGALRAEWPLEHLVPPAMLWDHTLLEARTLAKRALIFDAPFDEPNSRSWAEVTFGDRATDTAVASAPWPPESEVPIPGTKSRVRGQIDRLDLLSGRDVRVTDYKTGREPSNVQKLVFDGGRELQRVIYALAVHQLMKGLPGRIIARLIYLTREEAKEHPLPDVASAIRDLSLHVGGANDLLRRGLALPSADARDDWEPFQLALPAAKELYFRIKVQSMARELGHTPTHRTAP